VLGEVLRWSDMSSPAAVASLRLWISSTFPTAEPRDYAIELR
jgi:hypothetical protein